MSAISSEEIRKLVREVLKDALPAIKAAPAAAVACTAAQGGARGSKRVEVTIGHDGDLNAFARELVAAAAA